MSQSNEAVGVTPQESKESVLQDISRLYLLVHPLNEPFGTEILNSPYTDQIRKDYFFNAIRLFMPRSPSEVLAILPPVKPGLVPLMKNVRATKIQSELFGKDKYDNYSWITLYTAFEHLL